MFHYGNKPINNIHKDITNIDLLENQLEIYPEPISNVNLELESFEYSDDFEISILRLIHIIFGKNNEIDFSKIADYIGDGFERNDLYLFLKKNKVIRKYISIRQRTEWCNLLNKQSFFHYKFQNKYKINPTLDNLFSFFHHFFPLLNLNRYDNTKDKLKTIFDFLEIKHQYYKNGYYTSDKIFEETIIKLFLDGNNLYDWKIYQYYENFNNFKGKLITGFSELKYSIHLDKFY